MLFDRHPRPSTLRWEHELGQASDASARHPCDAIIETAEHRFAIEHTTVDHYPNQRADHAKSAQLIERLRAALYQRYEPDEVDTWLPAARGGEPPRRSKKHDKLINQLMDDVASCLAGHGTPRAAPTCRMLPGTSIRYHVDCLDGGRPQIVPIRDVDKETGDVLIKLIQKKAEQMRWYKENGYRTVLLLDMQPIGYTSTHVALSNSFVEAGESEPLGEAFLCLDEIYVVEDKIDTLWTLPVKCGDEPVRQTQARTWAAQRRHKTTRLQPLHTLLEAHSPSSLESS